MFCAYCGAKLEDGSMFCSNCGNKVAAEELSNQVTGQWSNSVEVVEIPIEASVEENLDTYNEVPEVNNSAVIEEQPVIVQEEQPVIAQEEQPVIVQEEQPEFTQQESVEEGPSVEAVLCMNCMAPLDIDSVFCANCGSHVSKTSYQMPTAVPIAEQANSESDPESKKAKKSKKGLLIAIIIAAVLVLGTGGFFIYSKITLGKLGDSVETFKTLVSKKGLENVDKYAKLIEEADEKASGWLVFGASDMESRLDDATIECKKLSEELLDLIATRDSYETLGETLIIDVEQEEVIDEYLYEFDAAIKEADTKKAEEVLASLELEKSTIIEDNHVYVSSLLEEFYNYENEEFTAEDWNLLENEIAMVENSIEVNDFVTAQEQIQNCSDSVASAEERIAQEMAAALYEKPEYLTVMIPDVMYDATSYRDEFEKALEAEIGIDVIFQQYDGDSYYDAMDTAFSSGGTPDVVYLSQDMYKDYQYNGYLTDITEYWNQSELLNSSNFYGEDVMERLKINGQLYGFTPSRGVTTVTYIRKSWLEQLGLSVPTTYDEFNQMLAAFTENKMGKSKKATYGMTAPGFLYDEEPYTSFLQPFYQNAVAEIYQTTSGEWVDGFASQEMVDALYRLQETYKLGYLDQGMADRTIDDAITEFASGKCGVISLWEGHGANYLLDELRQNGMENDIIVMAPLAEMGCYLEKEPAVLAITTSCENPGGVVKYFFEPMLDGSTVQKLWTYGVEGYHWETLTDGPYTGLLATLPYEGIAEGTYSYNFIDPLRTLATFEDVDPGVSIISDLAAESVAIANQYYVASPNLKYNRTYWYSFWDVYEARKVAVKKVILDGVDPVTAINEYKDSVQSTMDQVLSEMNQY